MALWRTRCPGYSARFRLSCLRRDSTGILEMWEEQGHFRLEPGDVLPKFWIEEGATQQGGLHGSQQGDPHGDPHGELLAEVGAHYLRTLLRLEGRWLHLEDHAQDVVWRGEDDGLQRAFLTSQGNSGGRLFGWKGNRLAYVEDVGQLGGLVQHWKHWAVPGGTLVVEERLTQGATRAFDELAFQYETVGGVWFPAQMQWLHGSEGDARQTLCQLELTAVVPLSKPKALAPPPVGPLADRVRAAWEKPARLHRGPLVVSADFQGDHRRPNAPWDSVEPLESTLELACHAPGSWRVRARKLAASQGNADSAPPIWDIRQLMALGLSRDFSSQLDFDSTFAGAEFLEEEGRIRVIHGPMQALQVEAGRIAGIDWDPQFRQTFRWIELEGQLICFESRVGTETIRFDHERAQGKLIPTGWSFAALEPLEGPRRLRFRLAE
ncbi:MAG: hypothetical protein H6827_07720 [Planctomycetes bacterium]|nr:hypothetical protein [Planctomycetota bacterium]HPF12635.1 hypothetical protein [Planctomycetota bacterium]